MKILALMTGLYLLLFSFAYADEGVKKKVIPYGDSLTTYGVCKKMMKVKEASHILEQHFKKKGLTIHTIDNRGRFIRVDVYRGKKHIDRIILDRKTGRMRSVY